MSNHLPQVRKKHHFHPQIMPPKRKFSPEIEMKKLIFSHENRVRKKTNGAAFHSSHRKACFQRIAARNFVVRRIHQVSEHQIFENWSKNR